MELLGFVLVPAWYLCPVAALISSAYLLWSRGAVRRRIRANRSTRKAEGVNFSASERRRMSNVLGALAVLAIPSPGILYFFPIPPFVLVGVCGVYAVMAATHLRERTLGSAHVWSVVALGWTGIAANAYLAWMPWTYPMYSASDLEIARGVDVLLALGAAGYLVLVRHVRLAARFDRDVNLRYEEALSSHDALA